MSLEAAILELNTTLKAAIAVMQSGALPSTPPAPAAEAGKTKTKTKETAAAPVAPPAAPAAPDKDLESMRAKLNALVVDNTKAEGGGKAAATEIMKAYKVKNVMALFELGKYDEVMGKLDAALAAQQAEDDGEIEL